MIKAGDCLTIPSVVNGRTIPHPTFVLTNPYYCVKRMVESVLIVNISTIYEGVSYDTSCVVDAGEHTLITHPSFVYYAFARSMSVAEIEEGLRKQQFIAHPPASAELMRKLLEGVNRTNRIRQGVMADFEACRKNGSLWQP